MIRATESADCAEIGTFRKIGRFAHFGEIGESPDKIIFYCQHNIGNISSAVVDFGVTLFYCKWVA